MSDADVDYIRRANAVFPIMATQNQYSMMWREPEKELFDVCEELNIGFVAYSPLGNGFLTGKYTKDMKYDKDDYRSFMKRFSSEVMENNQILLDTIKDIASSKNATSAQIALAWENAQRDFIVPIPGSTKISRLEENLGAMNIEITKEELAEINRILDKIEIDKGYF